MALVRMRQGESDTARVWRLKEALRKVHQQARGPDEAEAMLRG